MADEMDKTSNQLEDITTRLRDRIVTNLLRIEASHEDDGSSDEQRLKSLMGFFKLLLNAEEMLKRMQQERDRESNRGVDILEFRRQLEEQIARLVEPETKGAVS